MSSGADNKSPSRRGATGLGVPPATPLVEMSSISKHFPGVQALSGVDLGIVPGEIVGVAGENGSGKSTLMKVLAGSYRPDAGSISIAGDAVTFSSPADALNRGIGLVAQEVQVHADLTVAENLLFGQMPRTRLRTIRWRAAQEEAERILGSLDLKISPTARLGSLPLYQQHMISIARMLNRRPRVLILDEPTASLPLDQVETLMRVLRTLREDGTSVVYITHRLREYFEICDRLVVLRDGVHVADRRAAETDEDELVALMVGRNLSSIFIRPDDRERSMSAEPKVALRTSDLSAVGKIAGIDLEVGRGEILGIAGQAGSGRSTLARALFGAIPSQGTVEVAGRTLKLRSPKDAIAAGIGFVPDDRKGQGLVLSSSVGENITMASWDQMGRFGFRGFGDESSLIRDSFERLRIKAASPAVGVDTLSGGNQQKIVIAKWVARGLDVLILDEPTRGVDVGAKDEIYRLLEQLAARGTAIVVCSSELLELLRLSDRIAVMQRGRIVGEQSGAEATEASITAMAFKGAREPEGTV
ncbi:MAG: sugar ABC transporter ATP-binding protein [Actinomycetota bacterium]